MTLHRDLVTPDLKGWYVEITYEARHAKFWSRVDGPSDWSDWTLQAIRGILGFGLNGDILIDAKRPQCGGHFESRNIEVTAKWKEPNPSIRRLCEKCEKGHPLAVALKDMRMTSSGWIGSGEKCSLCGLVCKRGIVVPSAYRRFSPMMPHEEIEKELGSDVFFRKLRDWNAELFCISCERVRSIERGRVKRLLGREDGHFKSSWNSKDRETFEIYSSVPIEAKFWTAYFPGAYVKEFAISILADGEIIYGSKA